MDAPIPWPLSSPAGLGQKQFERIKGSLTRDFLLQVKVYPRPLSIPLGPFQIFTKIRGDVRSFLSIAGINDSGDKLLDEYKLDYSLNALF